MREPVGVLFVAFPYESKTPDHNPRGSSRRYTVGHHLPGECSALGWSTPRTKEATVGRVYPVVPGCYEATGRGKQARTRSKLS